MYDEIVDAGRIGTLTAATVIHVGLESGPGTMYDDIVIARSGNRKSQEAVCGNAIVIVAGQQLSDSVVQTHVRIQVRSPAPRHGVDIDRQHLPGGNGGQTVPIVVT